MKLFVKPLAIAGALFKGLCFLFVSLLNVILPPYGGGYLAMLTSLYPGYHPETGPVSIIVGVLYELVTGGLAGALFGWLYNRFVDQP